MEFARHHVTAAQSRDLASPINKSIYGLVKKQGELSSAASPYIGMSRAHWSSNFSSLPQVKSIRIARLKISEHATISGPKAMLTICGENFLVLILSSSSYDVHKDKRGHS